MEIIVETNVLYNLESDEFLFRRVKYFNPFENYFIWLDWDKKAIRYRNESYDVHNVVTVSSENFLKSLYVKELEFFTKHFEETVIVPIRYSTCDSTSIVIDYIQFDKAERIV